MLSKKDLETRLVYLCEEMQKAFEMSESARGTENYNALYNDFVRVRSLRDEYAYILTGKKSPSVWEVYNECEYDAKEYYGKLVESYYNNALAYAKKTHQQCELYVKNGKYYRRAI